MKIKVNKKASIKLILILLLVVGVAIIISAKQNIGNLKVSQEDLKMVQDYLNNKYNLNLNVISGSYYENGDYGINPGAHYTFKIKSIDKFNLYATLDIFQLSEENLSYIKLNITDIEGAKALKEQVENLSKFSCEVEEYREISADGEKYYYFLINLNNNSKYGISGRYENAKYVINHVSSNIEDEYNLSDVDFTRYTVTLENLLQYISSDDTLTLDNLLSDVVSKEYNSLEVSQEDLNIVQDYLNNEYGINLKMIRYNYEISPSIYYTFEFESIDGISVCASLSSCYLSEETLSNIKLNITDIEGAKALKEKVETMSDFSCNVEYYYEDTSYSYFFDITLEKNNTYYYIWGSYYNGEYIIEDISSNTKEEYDLSDFNLKEDDDLTLDNVLPQLSYLEKEELELFSDE